MKNWIKCSTRLPEIEGEYLTYVMDNGCSYHMKVQRFYKKPRLLKGIYGDSKTHWELVTWDDYVVTHWMDLPNVPEEYRE